MFTLIDESPTPVPAPTLEVGPRAGRLQLTVHDSFGAVEALRDEWNRLAEILGGDIFSTFEWCAAWWKHFSADRRLMIHVARCDGAIVAILPLFRETVRWGPLSIRVVRVIGTDHAGTRCFPLIDSVHCDELVSTLIDALNLAGAWDVLHFGDLSAYYPHAESLAFALSRSPHRLRVFVPTGLCPQAIFAVPESYALYIQSLSHNERSNLRKADNRLMRSHTSHALPVARNELTREFDRMCDWHSEFWNRQGEMGFFDKWPGAREFHAEIAATHADLGRLALLRLQFGEQTAGYVYAHRFGRRLHLFQTIRAPDERWEGFSPGRLLYCAAMRLAVRERLECIDAMSGFYEYKRRLGAEFLSLKSVTAMRQRWPSRIRVAAFRVASMIVHLVYFRVWFSHLAPAFRRRFSGRAPRFLHAGMLRAFIRSRFVIDALSGRPIEANGSSKTHD